MMTTVDQAPKIAHLGSVLEVVNKSESLKEALMMVAGSVVEPQMKWGIFPKVVKLSAMLLTLCGP